MQHKAHRNDLRIDMRCLGQSHAFYVSKNAFWI